MSHLIEIDDCDRAEAAAEQLRMRRYRSWLLAHPDCRDPDHPGCERCEEFNDADDGEGGDV